MGDSVNAYDRLHSFSVMLMSSNLFEYKVCDGVREGRELLHPKPNRSLSGGKIENLGAFFYPVYSSVATSL